MHAVLVSLAREQLQADTDAEQRLAAMAHLLVERFDKSRGAKPRGALAEGPDAWEHDALRLAQILRMRRDDDVAADELQRVPHRMEVAGAVIDDRDRAHVKSR